MRKLSKKDVSLEWFKPAYRRGNYSKIDDNLLLLSRVEKDGTNYKYDNKYIRFHEPLLDRYFPEGIESYRVAFSFDTKGNKLIIVFNPEKGIPFFEMKKNVKQKAISVKSLIDNIYDFLGLDKSTSKYYLKIHYFGTINGNELHILTPYDYISKKPLFESEARGEFQL